MKDGGGRGQSGGMLRIPMLGSCQVGTFNFIKSCPMRALDGMPVPKNHFSTRFCCALFTRLPSTRQPPWTPPCMRGPGAVLTQLQESISVLCRPWHYTSVVQAAEAHAERPCKCCEPHQRESAQPPGLLSGSQALRRLVAWWGGLMMLRGGTGRKQAGGASKGRAYMHSWD